MPALSPISVAFPVHAATPALESAFACIATQDALDLDILIVLNGSDAVTRDRVYALARSDARARVIELPSSSLAAALNAALRHARHDLVARMDADDACPPIRLRMQAERMASDPSIVGLGCAYRVCAPDGRPLFIVRPPHNPGELRWKLLLGNMLAHGSMMLRRDAVLAAGGYDDSLRRAQDFDLWLRLSRSHRLGALPDILYDYRAASESGADRSGPEQARIAGGCMLREWRLLPERDSSDVACDVLAGLLCRDQSPDEVRALLASHLTTHGPTRETLLAWNWAAAQTPAPPTHAANAARRALVREVTKAIGDLGAQRLWLYPAGSFTQNLLRHSEDLALPIVGILDDRPELASIPGWDIRQPNTVPSGEHVLITSDWHEHSLWDVSAPLRDRGVMVHRLHAFENSRAHEPQSLRRGTSLAPLLHADAA